MVEYLIDLNANEKEYTPITTIAIMNIYIRRGEQWKNKLLLTDGDDFCLKKLIVEIEEVEEDIT